MTQKHQLKRGFMKFQRLGPVKFGEQSRWRSRAPESSGLWAFPYPHFDLFYAYHKYTDLLPKEFRARRWPKDPKWYCKDYSESAERLDSITFRTTFDPEIDFEPEDRPYWLDDAGEWQLAHVKSEYFNAREKWIEDVGKKILPLRTFWYSGELYTRFRPNGDVGNFSINASGPDSEWTLMSVQHLAKLMSAPGGVQASDSYDGDGKPRTFSYSKDHLEVFIPRGRGIIRDKL